MTEQDNNLSSESSKSDGLLPVDVRIVENTTPQTVSDFLKPKVNVPQFKTSQLPQDDSTLGQLAQRHMMEQLPHLGLPSHVEANLKARYVSAMVQTLRGKSSYLQKQGLSELRRSLPLPAYGFKPLVDIDALNI